MNHILIAGATGYLGSHLLRELQNRNADFKALARNDDKLRTLGLKQEQMLICQLTHPETIYNRLTGIDTIISTIGITRQKDGLSYMDVDYQANMNLLVEARRAGVGKFVYVAALNGQQLRHLKIMEAKEKFVDALKSSGIDYCIIRPNGFFSDMKDFLQMASTGKVYLFGHGNYKLNPIHGKDLARVIMDAVTQPIHELEVGGPEIITQNEIARQALNCLSSKGKIIHVPDLFRKALITLMKAFTSSRTYGPYEFFLTMMSQHNIAPCYGQHKLHAFFEQQAKMMKKE
ncbi:SDR family oxidoreductase [Porifericola rhodea]|uniref:SDR family oxidoreductase n=1 Tax=Porifericola rhodea TaxID=930972 RepID=UPI0026670954|nr:SDR family oxidoreductase [Porifericola rhodea]WKN31513.1 SDR family oxidoreductase [Porifericola rhodea]